MTAQAKMLSAGRLTLLVGVGMTLAGFAWLLAGQDAARIDAKAYRLKHVSAEEIASQLEGLLSSDGAQHEVIADRDGNRVLVHGADGVQRLAAQLIETLDRPTPSQPAAPRPAAAASSPPVVRNYPIEASRLAQTFDELRRKFPPETGARIAADARSSQLLIVAPASLQQQIARTLQPTTTAAGEAAKRADAPTAAAASAAVIGPRAGAVQTANLRNISARKLEDELLRIWGPRLARTTTDDGDVAVFALRGEDAERPVLQVDRRQDAVGYLGEPDSARLWRRVVQALDRPREDRDGQRTDLVPLNRADPRKVEHAVVLLQTGGLPAGARATRLASAQVQQGDDDDEASPQAAAAQTAPGGAEPSSPVLTDDEGGLIGPVQIDFLEGLDAIVLRGHKRDVDRVRKIISEIETYSAETQPSIEIVQLQHVGSQVLADLVGTVYNEILSPRQGRVTIRPLVKPNALLLIGRPDSVETVKGLIDKLDQATAPETQFEVFRLKHISAVDVQTTVQNFFVDRLGQTQQLGAQAATGTARPGLGTRVNVVADYRTNTLIVQASPVDMQEVRRMIVQLDIESPEASNELKIFRLKNALASDVGPVLQDALNWQLIGSRIPLGASQTGAFGAAQTFGQQDERARLRSAMLTFMTVDAEGGKAIQSGQLADVRVTVDNNSNSLVVTAPHKSMSLIEALITELDALPNAQAQIKVFTIVNGDARALVGMLTQLLGQQTTAQPATAVFGQGALSPFLATGMQSGAASGESSLVPVRFAVDQRTNSIIATGSEGDLGVVEAILLRLDEQSLREHKTLVYWLANAPANDVATALNTWIQQRTTLFQQQLAISPESPDIQWNRRVIVVPETISNTIIISAAPELFDEVKHVVQSLDRRPPMIKIDVLIAEVTLTNTLEFGTELGLQDSLLYDRLTGAPGVAGVPGFNFNNKPLGDSTNGNPGNLLGQGLSSFGLGRINPTLGYGGLVLSASSDAVAALIRALEQQGRAQILSRPTVTTLDSQPASVNVGQVTARPGEISQNNVTTMQGINEVQVGLLLGVTPRVTPDGLVIMEIDAEKSRLDQTFVTIGENNIQNINNVTASTTISARSGQTVVFAGLIETTQTTDVRGIPFLSGLPVVGHLFKFTKNSDDRRELLIVLTPHIIRADNDFDRIRMVESERMSWCLTDVMALYGNVEFAARQGPWCDCETEVPMVYPDANPTGAVTAPQPMPMIDLNSSSQLSPTSDGQGRFRELQPSAMPSGAPPPNMSAPNALPTVNAGFYSPVGPANYPAAALNYQPNQPMPPGMNPNMPSAAAASGAFHEPFHEPVNGARRLPQAPAAFDAAGVTGPGPMGPGPMGPGPMGPTSTGPASMERGTR